MPWIAGAILGGAALSSGAANRAGNIQGRAADAATAETARQFDTSRTDLAPYRESGSAAIRRLTSGLALGPGSADARAQLAREIKTAIPHMPGTTTDEILANFAREAPAILKSEPLQRQYGLDWPALNALTSFIPRVNEMQAAAAAPGATDGDLVRRFTLADFESDPVNQLGFKFGLDEGTKALRRGLGAQGTLRTGAATKALTRFATDYAGSKAGESYSRFTADQSNIFNRLAALAGVGQAATTTTANLGANAATTIGQNTIGSGNARGAAAIGSGNAFGNALSQGANLINQRFTLDRIFPQRPPVYTMDSGSVFSPGNDFGFGYN